VFRSDHEAALARLQALEEELARERDKDVKQEARLAALEAQLATAKDQLRETAAELALHKPPPPKSESKLKLPAGSERTGDVPRPPGRGAAIAAVTALTAVTLIGFLMMKRGNRSGDPPAGRATLPVTVEVPNLYIPDQVSEMLDEMRSRAEKELPGARLVQLRSKGITSQGELHATFGELEAVFQREMPTPEPEVDPNVPIGAAPPVEPNALDRFKCLYLTRNPRGWDDSALYSMNMCALGDLWANTDLHPQCSMRSIWARAITDGAPRDAVAEIGFTSSHVWNFRINDQRMQFSQNYVDDCRR
jgi:hypothetical protein